MEVRVTPAVALLGIEALKALPAIGGIIAHLNKIVPIVADFDEDEVVLPADISVSSNTELDGLDVPLLGNTTGIDPVTGEYVIDIAVPVGGYRWELSSVPDPVESVYGFAILTDDGSAIKGIARLDPPVELSAIGHFVETGPLQIRIPSTFMRKVAEE